jgi:hypothetical protein
LQFLGTKNVSTRPGPISDIGPNQLLMTVGCKILPRGAFTKC